MSSLVPQIGRPDPFWTLLEGRALFEVALALPGLAMVLAQAPRGDGHPVLVLPGFLADDSSTLVMRTLLDRLGYAAYGLGEGRTLGPVMPLIARIGARVEELVALHGRTVSLIGSSLGGIAAREVARRLPDRVRQVITLGAPFRDARSTMISPMYFMLSPLHAQELLGFLADRSRPPPVPLTAILSRTDGMVPWQACIEDPGAQRQTIAVVSSHHALTTNPGAIAVIADRLAQAESGWQAWQPGPWSYLLLTRVEDGTA
ncbi:esterase/lipase family protein [Zavarzinia sp. CC-PAN008]|uniref:esterase/lipase family protein n=1 Tax=Zavarzinia sp. CC-PAN008 TaxID=3243332 RepID=UPI003F746D25